MNKKNVIIIAIIVMAIIGFIFLITKGEDDDKKDVPSESTVNVNDAAYTGKKIYIKNGDVIIEEDNGSQTIETTKTLEETDLVEADASTKEKYKITDVKVTKYGAQTKITGKVKSNNSQTKDITVQAKFYSNENRVKGSGSTRLNGISNGKTADFEITIVGDLTQYQCKVNVEFTN